MFYKNGAASLLALKHDERRRKSMMESPEAKKSLYHRVGGSQTVNIAVDYVYRRIAEHHRLRDAFYGLNIRLIAAHQKVFISHKLGGFPNFQHTTMADIDSEIANLDLTATDVEDLNNIIKDAMDYAQVPKACSEMIMKLLKKSKEEVLGRAAANKDEQESISAISTQK